MIYQKTVVAQAMEHIRHILTSGKFKPGDKIPTEQELADQFGIGRSSIREAIKIFQYLGILKTQVPKGTFLCDKTQVSSEALTWSIFLRSDDMIEIIRLRQIIEESALCSALDKYNKDQQSFDFFTNQLDEVVQKMREAVKANSVDRFVQEDYNFHALIVKEGENKLFQEIYRTLYSLIKEEIKEYYSSLSNLKEMVKEHQQIANFIKTGEREKAQIRHSAHFPQVLKLLNVEPNKKNKKKLDK